MPVGTVTTKDGVVAFRAFEGATPAQIKQMKAYVKGCNRALLAGYLSPTGRVSTTGELRRRASKEAHRERKRAERAQTPYGEQVAGHVPDTTWTGNPVPYRWMRLDANVNQSLGSQAERYPTGFRPAGFIFEARRPKSRRGRDPLADHGIG
jgi:hypothetical protein